VCAAHFSYIRKKMPRTLVTLGKRWDEWTDGRQTDRIMFITRCGQHDMSVKRETNNLIGAELYFFVRIFVLKLQLHTCTCYDFINQLSFL